MEICLKHFHFFAVDRQTVRMDGVNCTSQTQTVEGPGTNVSIKGLLRVGKEREGLLQTGILQWFSAVDSELN